MGQATGSLQSGFIGTLEVRSIHWGVEMGMEGCVTTVHCREERQAGWGKGKSSQPQSMCV